MSRLDQPHDRGEFFRSLGRLMAGFVAEQVEEALTSRAPRLLRPPGALDELAFLTACSRCDKCMLACPQGSILTATSSLALGTPYLIPHAMPCFLCEELPCIKACPDGALVWPQRTIQGTSIDGPRAVRMGVAVVDESRCLSFPGKDKPATECRICHDRCPYPGEAIQLAVPEEEGVPRPQINEAHCTGCGLCAFACVATETAILILPK